MSEKSKTLNTVAEVLSNSSFSFTFSRLRRQIGFATRIHVVSMQLADLAKMGQVSLNCGTYWSLKKTVIITPPPSVHESILRKQGAGHVPPIFGDPALIGPVWEPAFALRLWQNGLRVIQQYPAEGFYLDIALTSNDGRVRLDIEVDGRTTHCDRFGRRRVGDIIRDSRLLAAGWSIKRFWVAELMRDMAGCVTQVEVLWNQLTGRGQ